MQEDREKKQNRNNTRTPCETGVIPYAVKGFISSPKLAYAADCATPGLPDGLTPWGLNFMCAVYRVYGGIAIT